MMYLTAIAFCALIVLAQGAQHLANPSFEGGPPPPNWSAFGSGYTTSTTTVIDGKQSISCSTGSTSASFGASTGTITINQASAAPIRISGWSKSTSTVSGTSDSNYAIYLDMTYTDNTNEWGVNVPFATGAAHDWQFQCDTFIPKKAIASFTAYAMFRYHSGTVYFDKFNITDYTVPSVVTSASNPLKVLVPLYIYPGSAWDSVQGQSATVPITVIANPNSGPGTSADSNYVTYINKLAAGKTGVPAIPVIGYVPTNYGSRSLSQVYDDIDDWKSFYPNTAGIFVDEAAYTLEGLGYYEDVRDYIKAVYGSNGLVFFNPGTSTPENYTAFSDSIMAFEDTYSSFTSTIPDGWPRAPCYTTHTPAWKYKSNAVIHTTSSSNYQNAVDLAISQGYGYVFVTDDIMPNPYDALPSYWSSLCSYIAGKNV